MPFYARFNRSRCLHLGTPSSPLPFPVHIFNPAATLSHSLNAEDALGVPKPAVIVLQEWWGVDDQIKAHAQRVANGTGATAIVPDLYDGKVALDEAEAHHLMSSLDWKKSLMHLDSLVSALRSSGHEKRKVASLGFCMGGALSLALGSKRAESNPSSPLNACVSFYGIPPASVFNIDDLPIITPVQAHFGVHDTHKGFSDADTARALESRWLESIRSQGGMHAKGFHRLEEGLFVYDGVGHGFMNEVRRRPEFNQDLVNKVWASVFAFLTEHLKTV